VTGLDWLILAFAAAMGVWGYQQGLIVGVLSLSGFAVGLSSAAASGRRCWRTALSLPTHRRPRSPVRC
jgi:hypothetical protein